VSQMGLEQGVVESGFQFAGAPVRIERSQPEPTTLFDVAGTASLYTKVHADLGMISDPEHAGAVILASMEELHTMLMADRLPGDVAVMPFFAIDLAERDEAFEDGERAFNSQLPELPEMFVYRPLYNQLSPEQLNRRSFAGEAAIKGWSARAMILGGNREDAPGLLFTDRSAVDQIKAYKELRTAYEAAHPRSALALLNTFDHLVIDAAIRETNEANNESNPLLDHNTSSRTPQAGDPETGLVETSDGFSWGPDVNSVGDQVTLGGSDGCADPSAGLRVSAGPKQELAA
jgi:hypothetical protein